MTLAKFIEEYNYAPWELEKVAYCAQDITDSPELVKAAKDYLLSEQKLNEELEKAGYTIG